jgi:5-methylcytosine-specific restriction enzyme B
MPTSEGKNPLEILAALICSGLPAPEGGLKPLLKELFGGRYHQQDFKSSALRDAYSLGSADGNDGVPYAGLINPDNPPSGPYGGTSVVWFPKPGEGSLIGLLVGTRGLSPDEGILTRPGHRRRIAALRRYLSRMGVEVWTKPDPSAIGVTVPKVVKDRFSDFEHAFRRYEREMYCIAKVPTEVELGTKIVQAFFDLYAYERGWKVMKPYQPDYDNLHSTLRNDLFLSINDAAVDSLLRQRRFVVLQGPPGTGKTRLAEEVRNKFFGGRGRTIQFHPAVTYEDFIVGLSPDPEEGTLRFNVRRGWLLEAARAAKDSPYLLVIDEVNRADLGKVLGEAIYLFEAGEVGGERARQVELPHAVDGERRFSIPENLYILATMNTADRSIASMDLAIRRRFAFVNLPPQRQVVAMQGLALATEAFDWLTDVFVEHAPDDALDLLPGHAYFLANNEAELLQRFRYELLPLLEEYLRQGFLGSAAGELAAVRDRIEDRVSSSG